MREASPAETKIFFAIDRYQNRKLGYAEMGRQQLANVAGIGDLGTVTNATATLLNEGWLKRVKLGRKGRGVSRWMVCIPPKAKPE
jgi:hypothetical protein